MSKNAKHQKFIIYFCYIECNIHYKIHVIISIFNIYICWLLCMNTGLPCYISFVVHCMNVVFFDIRSDRYYLYSTVAVPSHKLKYTQVYNWVVKEKKQWANNVCIKKKKPKLTNRTTTTTISFGDFVFLNSLQTNKQTSKYTNWTKLHKKKRTNFFFLSFIFELVKLLSI